MLYSLKLKAQELLMVKKVLDFPFSIKNLTEFWHGSLSIKREGRGDISRQILLRNLKVICQQALNRQCQPGWNTHQN